MIGCIQVPRGHIRDSLRAAARLMVMAGVLAGCSSVPDAINPVEWYKGASDFVTGKDRPEVASPSPAKADSAGEAAKDVAAPKKEPAKGLVADRGNAKYADSVRREVTPTKPLARRTPPPAATDTQLATEPKDAPKAAPGPDARAPSSTPAVAKSDLPPAAAQVAQNRDTGPAAPPATAMDNAPPARPDIPSAVPLPGQKVKPVLAHYQKRLDESASTVVRPDIVDTRHGAAMASGGDEPVHLIPPSRQKVKASGGRFAAAPAPLSSAPAASFQVASVDFRAGSAELTREDRQAIADVARLYHRSGGIVRIVGLAPAPSFSGGDDVATMMGAMDRANAVAKELSRRGVPGHKIMVGADPAPAIVGNGGGARVFLDVI